MAERTRTNQTQGNNEYHARLGLRNYLTTARKKGPVSQFFTLAKQQGSLLLGDFSGRQDTDCYRLVDEKYQVTFSVEFGVEQDFEKARIPPFEEVEIDLKYVFGDE